MFKIQLKYTCSKDSEMFDLVRVESSSLYVVLDFVGWEFPITLSCLSLLKAPAINISIFLLLIFYVQVK